MSLNQKTTQEIGKLFVIGLIKNYSFHYKTLKFCATHGMIVDNFHEMISFEGSKWLKKFKLFHTENINYYLILTKTFINHPLMHLWKNIGKH